MDSSMQRHRRGAIIVLYHCKMLCVPLYCEMIVASSAMEKFFDIPKTLKSNIKGVRGIVCEDKFGILHYNNTAPLRLRTPVLTAD